MLDKFGVAPSEIGRKTAVAEDFDAPTERMVSITPLLYQSGYITIKDYDKELDLYTLDIPNKEVRIGLMKSLLPNYVASKTPEANTMVAYLSRDIRFCLPFLNVIIRNMRGTTNRCFILYSVCWAIM